MFCVSEKGCSLIEKGCLLWSQHSEWTRMAFTGIIFHTPNKEYTAGRLLRNPWDFACYFKCFYGENIGYRFGCLLTEHLSLALALVKASVEGNTNTAKDINIKLFKNAHHISAFLASINPYWSFNHWRDMFYLHLDLAGKMAEEDIKGEYEKSIATYDDFEIEVMGMARMMIEGFLRQFPYSFYQKKMPKTLYIKGFRPNICISSQKNLCI